MACAKEQNLESSFFSSKRERRLWLWTLAVLVAIYSTLGLARVLAVQFGDLPIFGVWFFLLGCVMVLGTVITQGLRVRPSGLEIGVALGVAAAYLLVLVRMSIPTERSHLVEYGIVGVLIYEALLERATNGRRVPLPSLIALGMTTCAGVIDECIQAILPSRVFEIMDMVFNFVAGALAIGASVTLRWARRVALRRVHAKTELGSSSCRNDAGDTAA